MRSSIFFLAGLAMDATLAKSIENGGTKSGGRGKFDLLDLEETAKTFGTFNTFYDETPYNWKKPADHPKYATECYEYDTDAYSLLPGAVYGPCVIPFGSRLLFVLFSVTCSDIELPPFIGFEEQRTCVDEYAKTYLETRDRESQIWLDGVLLVDNDIAKFQITTGQLSGHMPEKNWHTSSGIRGGNCLEGPCNAFKTGPFTMVASGLAMAFENLERGKHKFVREVTFTSGSRKGETVKQEFVVKVV